MHLETALLEAGGICIHSDAEALDPCTVNSLCALFIGGGGTSEGQESILLQINIQNLRCFFEMGPSLFEPLFWFGNQAENFTETDFLVRSQNVVV